ncbi:MAG: hypothetical protein ACK55I_30965, partial [bacterium]
MCLVARKIIPRQIHGILQGSMNPVLPIRRVKITRRIIKIPVSLAGDLTLTLLRSRVNIPRKRVCR